MKFFYVYANTNNKFDKFFYVTKNLAPHTEPVYFCPQKEVADDVCQRLNEALVKVICDVTECYPFVLKNKDFLDEDKKPLEVITISGVKNSIYDLGNTIIKDLQIDMQNFIPMGTEIYYKTNYRNVYYSKFWKKLVVFKQEEKNETQG